MPFAALSTRVRSRLARVRAIILGAPERGSALWIEELSREWLAGYEHVAAAGNAPQGSVRRSIALRRRSERAYTVRVRSGAVMDSLSQGGGYRVTTCGARIRRVTATRQSLRRRSCERRGGALGAPQKRARQDMMKASGADRPRVWDSD
jgi:hypothetical protein